jgi:hypothetical protein
MQKVPMAWDIVRWGNRLIHERSAPIGDLADHGDAIARLAVWGQANPRHLPPAGPELAVLSHVRPPGSAPA